MKPEISKKASKLTKEELALMTETFDDKKIIGHVRNNGAEILFLEDGSEVIRDQEGKFLNEWPEETKRKKKS
tara:strand:+ start:11657 stop:11872 length:216 start_codon:yes stop_codon:yes gene_type:complete